MVDSSDRLLLRYPPVLGEVVYRRRPRRSAVVVQGVACTWKDLPPLS